MKYFPRRVLCFGFSFDNNLDTLLGSGGRQVACFRASSASLARRVFHRTFFAGVTHSLLRHIGTSAEREIEKDNTNNKSTSSDSKATRGSFSPKVDPESSSGDEIHGNVILDSESVRSGDGGKTKTITTDDFDMSG